MRRRGKVDNNQSAIVECFRSLGCGVLILSNVGNGCPDIAVGCNGLTCLVEIKNGTNGKLTSEQVVFFSNWDGMATVVRNIDDAIQLVDFMRRCDIGVIQNNDI